VPKPPYTVWLAVAFLSAWTSTARAADPVESCAASAEKAQELRDARKLMSARASLLQCAREDCPGPIRKDCARWLTEVEESQPSVVFSAHDAKGGEVVNLRVLLDGRVAVEAFDGKAVAVDPGTHVFRFESPRQTPVEQRILIREGEKNRVLRVDMGGGAQAGAPRPAGPDARASESGGDARKTDPGGTKRIAAYALGGLAVVALGSFAYFGGTGVSDRAHLLDTCRASCAESDLHALQTKYTIADVSLVVTLVAAGLGTYLFLSSGTAIPRSGASASSQTLFQW
jgi:hypothetical protein